MRSVRFVVVHSLALLLLAVANVRAEDTPSAADASDCPCCKKADECPLQTAGEQSTCPAVAAGKARNCNTLKLGGVTPRIIIIEEEETLLGVAAAVEPDCCKGPGCCEAKTACAQQANHCATKACTSEKSKQMHLAAQGQIGQCTGQNCEASVCSKSTCGKKSCDTKVCVEKACAAAACTAQECAAKQCASNCAVAGKEQCTVCPAQQTVQAGVCHDPAGCCHKGKSATSCQQKCESETAGQNHGETAQALIELMEKLGPSVLEGTEFEKADMPPGLVPEVSGLPLSIRQQLVQHVRELEAEGFKVEVEVNCDDTCTAQFGLVESDCDEQSCPPRHTLTAQHTEQLAESVTVLREAAETLEKTAAQLERHNLYDPSDATRDLAAQLRLEGRRMQQAYTAAVERAADTNSAQAGPKFEGLLCDSHCDTREMTDIIMPIGLICGQVSKHPDCQPIGISLPVCPTPSWMKQEDTKSMIEQTRAMWESLGTHPEINGVRH